MNKLKFLMMGVLFIGLAGLSSCKKEDRITKNLWKNGGEWKIVNSEETTTRTNGDNSHYIDEINGDMVFKKDGTGTLTVYADGDTETMAFTYSNTEDKLILIRNNENQTYDMDWTKNNLKLTWHNSWQDFIDNEQVDVEYVSVIKLEKQ